MQHMNRLYVAGCYFLGLCTLLACSNAFACFCGGPYQAKTMREVAEWYANRPDVALVFEGKVIKQEVLSGSIDGPSTAMSMTLSGQHRIVEFDVTRVFRGTGQAHLSIVTGLNEADCGYVFRPGEIYLVYASSGAGGMWFTSLCSGTSGIEDAGTAIRFLTGEKPTGDDSLSPGEYQKQYYEKVLPKRTGSVCGKVLKPDGTPLKGAMMHLWEVRDDDLPPQGADDPNTSTETGHFCIQHAFPGRYLLTAETSDFDHDARYLGFFPGVSIREQAIPLDISAGVRLPDVTFTTLHETLYTIRIRVRAQDGTQLSYQNGCGVMVDSVYWDPLSYHISHTLQLDGSYTFGYIPAGKYVVATYFQPNFEGGELKAFREASKWKPTRQEVIVTGNTEVVIQMEPVKPD
jgi:hypothetical protein